MTAINPVNKTVRSDDEVANATKDYFCDGVGKNKDNTIPLIHSRSLYIVMHPDFRRSARVKVVAQWLGKVLGNGGV